MGDKVKDLQIDVPAAQTVPMEKKFDFAAMRIDGDVSMAEAEELYTDILVRKPSVDEFFRALPGNDYRGRFMIYEDKKDMGSERYLLTPNLGGEILQLARLEELRLCYSANQLWFLLPIAVPTLDQSWNTWHLSRSKAVSRSEGEWIRLQADMRIGTYRVFQAQGDFGDVPEPPMSFLDFVQRAFGNRVIDSEDHPVYRRLRGHPE